ncbi:MAG TPA: hypothetical protein VFV72_17055 [Candidatus Limnocylindrales bacterium]|nr:hypothetical protein [Candidatus Limnocylindrales bacterium]
MVATERSARTMSLAAAAGIFAALTAVVPAVAAPLAHELDPTTEVAVVTLCGEDWDVVTTSTTLFMLKAGHDEGAPPKFFFRQRYEAVYRDPSDPDRGFVLSGNDVFVDVRVTRIEGTVFTFESIESGVQLAVSTLDGRLVAHNPGHMSWTFLVDTHGSTDPADYELLDTMSGPIRGPHPIDDDAPCDAIGEAIAS